MEWYEQYELDGRPVPDWVRQLSYPCLPPPDMPAAPPVGENAHFYLDCFWTRHRAAMAVLCSAALWCAVWLVCGVLWCGVGCGRWRHTAAQPMYFLLVLSSAAAQPSCKQTTITNSNF